MKTQSSGLQNQISLRRGFTLVELLLVLVILGILAAIVLPQYTDYVNRARRQAAMTQINNFGAALDTFEVDVGRYPSTTEGLEALRQPPADAVGWKGPYLKTAVPLDPWRHTYVYTEPGEHNPTTYDILSTGKDGQEGTEDDITSWELAAN